MSTIKNIELPDIGDFDEVEVIEILVSVGDKLETDDSIITLESDKASMEIPTPSAGVVSSINVNIGDKIKQGDVVVTLESEENSEKKIPSDTEKTSVSTQTASSIIAVNVPDIGDFDEVEVIEILASVGDEVSEEDSIITLESDKASMEIPTPVAGKIVEISVNLGDKLSLGDLILSVESTSVNSSKAAAEVAPTKTSQSTSAPAQAVQPVAAKSVLDQSVSTLPTGESHASPSIRKMAREIGVDLSRVTGTGQKGRVLDKDLKAYVKQIITSGGGSSLPKTPVIDFSKFGETETLALSRINKLSGKHLTACWLNIPHVTQFDEVNIDQMEAFRQEQKAKGVKLTPLVFIMKAVIQALKNHPRFNASLDESGENLIIKKYFNLGIAMDTPNGLVVPVIKNVERKSLTELATELAETSAKARDGKLKPGDMQGAGFTISSLGGIGGTQFTPIVNSPEVAILGVSKSQTKPIWDGKNFVPTLTLPLALSYDHRVIDGAQGGRFMADLNSILSDIREILL
ncbi:MAG: dihydrolipoyllysine-residue acetyltransferase [Candidatus Thioglobus sp.]|jgi:pyruvate dehydrogenase E2 component (dihydrolipoamide acetyltransferase)|nr:dihydrolipoyllysine-residue acetyltransferase [Candidatus Thioglobus sp.]MBT3277265.1 dihydrolipoyllysine-residue acetyltransferase [Candidatus Thioglobus sp.]MBT3447596.1 dihydrolipoyllysine-residue acetyltransferase [Candidatus Thioglobus sp.]MBT3744418.1 dihydrolipoyllysine-residue acetyltransferase [Candidatus Thioglobus sp.]MBT4000569.1 dihydrolipoyllysine-residue acetyltransferase [Candidatus Thioglobus sp.]MBT4181878.1 dihydrolipoyllysine-residue acetyltransferase [Candidatus Thioglo